MYKYCCYTKSRSVIINFTLQNHWMYITDVSKYHHVDTWSMDWTILPFTLKKHTAILVMCYDPPLVNDKPPAATTFVKLVYNDNSQAVCRNYNSNSCSTVSTHLNEHPDVHVFSFVLFCFRRAQTTGYSPRIPCIQCDVNSSPPSAIYMCQ